MSHTFRLAAVEHDALAYYAKGIGCTHAGVIETTFNARRESVHRHQIEDVGKKLRAMMPFLNAKQVPRG